MSTRTRTEKIFVTKLSLQTITTRKHDNH